MINSINFGAKLISTTQIKKLNPNTKTYSRQEVSVVEIDPDNIEDIFAIYDAARSWINEKYASNIASTANCLFHNNLDRKKYKVLALTKQLDNLESLIDNKILGIAEFQKTGTKAIELNYIQVNTNDNLFLDKPTYKEVGTRIMDSLKTLYDKIELTAARGSVKNFYIKNGFKACNESKNRYVWEKA